jgi:hypothetical protein
MTRWAVVVAACALAVRLAYVASLGWHLPPERLIEDNPDYYEIATNLAAGHGYSKVWKGPGPAHGTLQPTAFRAPLWPGVQAALYSVVEPTPTRGRLLTVVIDAASCVLVVVLGARLVSPAAGIVAGLLAAVYPPAWVYTGQLWSEPLMGLVVLVTLLAADRYRRAPWPGRAAALGAAAGLVTLTRPNGLVVAAFLGGWLVWHGRRRLRAGLAAAGACAGALALVVAPWVAYSSVRMGTLVPITTQGGSLLAGDFSDTIIDRSSPHWGWWDYDLVIREYFASPDEVTWGRRLQRIGRAWIADNPGGTALAVAYRTVRYFDLYAAWDDRRHDRIPTPSGRLNVAAVASWWVAAPLGVAGLALLRRQGRLGPWGPALCTLAAFAVSGMLLGGATRYRVPSDPVVLLAAAAALTAGVRRPVAGSAPTDGVPGRAAEAARSGAAPA